MRKANRKKKPDKQEDELVAFPFRVPQSLKEKYDAMEKEDKSNARRRMINKLRNYKDGK